LERAVRENIERKSKSIYHSYHHEHNPERKTGEYETRTVISKDTTYTFQRKVYEPEESVFQLYQTILLETGQLHADSLQLIFDSLLVDRNIHAESIIGITASFRSQLNDWSADTMAININCRAGFLHQGDSEGINYYAYMHYSFATLWKLMNKTPVYILFICSLLSGLVLIWWINQCRQARKNGITLLKDGNYRIKDILFDVKEQRFIADEKEQKLTSQLNKLILLFLSVEDHRVNKMEIKQKLWPKMTNATNNMTSAVNRLNTELKKINCAYLINTDPKNEAYYIFSRS
jgi:hypothetical protein